MKKRNMKHYTVNLYIDTVEQLKDEGKELGPYLRELLDIHVETIEQKEEEIAKLQIKLNKLVEAVAAEKIRKEFIKEKFKLSEEKEEWLSETVDLLEKDEKYFEGRRNYFNNVFGENFDTKDFKELITKYKEKRNGK